MDLLNKYSPILYLHKDEKYFPCSIDWLLERSKLIDNNKIPPAIISKPTNTDLYDITKLYKSTITDGTVNLSFPEEIYSGDKNLIDVPCYGTVRFINGKIYLTYIFLYPYNGPYPIVGLFKAGEHPGDMEHITIELDNYNMRIMFGAHGELDGRWIERKDIEYQDVHPVAYVAKNGHGLYPDEGTVLRIYGFANDLMNKGYLWKPKVIQFFSETENQFNKSTMGWTVFSGRIGGSDKKGDTSGITGLSGKNWYGNDGISIDILDKNKLKNNVLVKNKQIGCCNIM